MRNETQTKTGAKVHGYSWISYYDDDQEKRISDWDRATECAACGRMIVHVYTIELANGAIEEVGRECAHIALGWSRRRPKELARLVALAQKEQHDRDWWAAEYQRAAVDSIDEARALCIKRNRSPYRDDFTPEVLIVVDMGGSYYAVPAVCEITARRIAAEHGWRIV